MQHILEIFFSLIIPVVVMRRVHLDDSKIQGGIPVTIEKWPYVGSYLVEMFGIPEHQCMTSLITPRLAMTAAHCIIENICVDPQGMVQFQNKDQEDLLVAYVVMGTDKPQFPVGDFQKIRIIRAYIHDLFYTAARPYLSQYDIAVVKVRHSFSLNRRVALAPIYPSSQPDTNPVFLGLSKCKVAGWGHRDINGSYNTAWDGQFAVLLTSLHEIEVKLLTADICCKNYIVPRYNMKHEECVGNLTAIGHGCYERIHPGDSTAPGDSGAAIECSAHSLHGSPRYVVGTHTGGMRTLDPQMPYRMINHPMLRTTIKTMVDFTQKMAKGGVTPPPGFTDPPDVIPTTPFERFTDELK